MSDSHQSLQPCTHNEASSLPSSSWQQFYLRARHESDLNMLTEAVMAAEGAIFERMRELETCSNHTEERAEMQSAIAELLEIKIGRLGWPRP
jgi:hypothetical protein